MGSVIFSWIKVWLNHCKKCTEKLYPDSNVCFLSCLTNYIKGALKLFYIFSS